MFTCLNKPDKHLQAQVQAHTVNCTLIMRIHVLVLAMI
uniref:Uncharacterized protein n=1 Tax=Anguilla anguilla TaxID=7936 RepID=A0A0E9S592_ANGAN